MLDENTTLIKPLTSDVGYNLESAQASALSSLSETAQALTVAINKIAAYVPTQWVNGTEPDIDEDNLNKIEEGIKNATNAVNSSIDAITELAAAVDTLNGKVAEFSGEINVHYILPFYKNSEYLAANIFLPFYANNIDDYSINITRIHVYAVGDININSISVIKDKYFVEVRGNHSNGTPGNVYMGNFTATITFNNPIAI